MAKEPIGEVVARIDENVKFLKESVNAINITLTEKVDKNDCLTLHELIRKKDDKTEEKLDAIQMTGSYNSGEKIANAAWLMVLVSLIVTSVSLFIKSLFEK